MHTVFMLQAQNTSLPVGAIPGAIDVSPMGAATYTIPIEVVPGTQGVQPNLSIVYNSMGGMGLLGMKWNLAGLSAITRCGQNPYYDEGNLTNIVFYAYDRFTLDGNRLLVLNGGVYGDYGAEYATEMENFTRVISYDGIIGTPDYFKVFADDGTIMEYGKSTNSKQKLGTAVSSVLSWYLNKVTDANGNYMTYHYGLSPNKEIWVDSIRYTGNGFQPYAKVAFTYKDLPDSMKNTYFVGGYGIPQTKLLETITVYYENAPVRKYKFFYNTEDAGVRSAHLKEIVLFGEGSNPPQLNATKIEWGEQSNASPYFPYYTSYVLNNSSDGSTLPEGYIIPGDFNGDGFMDFVIYGQTSHENTWGLYTGKLSNYGFYIFDKTGITEWHNSVSVESNCYFYKADVNGDGADELITATRGVNYTSYTIRIFSLKDGVTQIGTDKEIRNMHEVFFGDFDSDGASEMLFVQKDSINRYSFMFCKSNLCLDGSFGLPSLTLPCKVRVGDFNGDGKSEVEINFNNNDLSTFYFDGASFNFLCSQQTSDYSYDRYSGDFNGDGITDLLTYEKESGSSLITWKLYFGKGNGTFSDSTIVNDLNRTCEGFQGRILPKYKIMIADLDGDGKDDIIQVIYSPQLKILYSKGCINGKYKYKYVNQTIWYDFTLPKHFNISDFNNDGILDMVVQTKRTIKPVVIYLQKNKEYEFTKKITDGLGKEIKLSYIPKYYFASIPYTSNNFIKFFLSPLDTLHISNELNGFNTLKYKYNTPVYSAKRRTFLGFEEFICINNQENITNESLFTVDATKQMMKLSKQMSFYGNKKTSEKVFTIVFWRLNDNRFAFNYNNIEENGFLSDTKITTSNNLDTEGRVATSNTKTYNSCNTTSWLHSEAKTYKYQTITLNGNQKKTVLTQILTTQQFGINGVIIADTITYGYYPASDKGRLEWMRKGNIHGVMKTSYGNYSSTGVYKEKTVIAGSESRKEKYEYDDTRRFVTKITNPLNHFATFTYAPGTGNKTSETDINGLTTTYKYDTFGNLYEINYPDGTITTISVKWNTATIPPNTKYYTTTTSSGKEDVVVYYDILGREVCRKEDGSYFKTIYNSKGQVEKTIGFLPSPASPESDGIIHTYTYDEYGRKKIEHSLYTYLYYSYNKRKVVVTDFLRNSIQSWKDYDALGRITTADDAGGNIAYAYEVTPSKHHKTTITTNAAITTIFSDLWGNRLSITDPDAGTITSTYNGFSELEAEIDARGDTTSYQYDKLGRITQKKYSAPGELPLINTYTYDSALEKGIGKLSQIKVSNGAEENFIYDRYSRLSEHKKKIAGTVYTHKYSYNANGLLENLTYPGNFAVKYSYSSYGSVNEIRRNSDNSLIYKVNARNKFQAPIQCEYGNGLVTNYKYSETGQVTGIKTGWDDNGVILDPGGGGLNDNGETPNGLSNITVLDYTYTYDKRGLMDSRSESVANRLERFTYDNLDRLTETRAGTGAPQTLSYYNDGSISQNSEAGHIYYYNGLQPHAVTKIEQYTPNISNNLCAVEYNFFNQPTQITEEEFRLELSYGANQQRTRTVNYQNKVKEKQCTHVSKYYEVTIDYANNIGYRDHHYIYGDNGIVALHIATSYPGGDTMYYIHTDHLGSYCVITDAAKQVAQSNRFDPWGNPLSLTGLTGFTLINRGFTGHEHYPQFKIINMNGRLYDPVIGRFFSPDKYVANSSFTQDFNRYSYARNNPLHYTDPSGHKITGYDIFSFIMFPVFLPARVLSEGFQWINDKINGDTRYGGYFAPSYLMGQTAPGSLVPYNPVNQIPFGHPLYTSPGANWNYSRGFDHFQWSLGADDELSDWIFHKFNEQEYVRKVGSKKLMWMSKRAAATGGIVAGALGKFITGTYVGKFEGVSVFESKKFGSYKDGASAVTIPEKGIFIGTDIYKEGDYDREPFYLKHEFGHILQYRRWGAKAYWNIIARESFFSAMCNTFEDHNKYWTETYANYLSSKYFFEVEWPIKKYPIQNISDVNMLRLMFEY